MSKMINFRTVYYPYNKVIDSIIEPIEKHLPNCIKNSDYLEECLNISFFHEIIPQKGVFMSHGLADKNWREARNIKDYDYICVSGWFWKQKLIDQGILSDKILINGFPKLDPLFSKQKNENISNDKIEVLFAPTHNLNNLNNDVSLYNKFSMCFNEIPNNINIYHSCHPANHWGNMTYDKLLSSDVVISDCSSIIYEAWALGIPVVFADWLLKQQIMLRYPGSFEEVIYKDSIGFHASDEKEMLKMIYIAKEKGIDDQTKTFIEGIFPTELRGKSGKITAEMLLDIANK